MKRPSGAKGDELAALAPAFVEMTDRILYEEVWEREGLSKRDRSLLTVAALMTANRHQQLEAHIGLALDNGVTREEMGEALLHLAFYASWPASVSASRTFLEVVKKRGE
ncbi:carboxymuconolactone decarboxylase family protein [Rhizorhabdus histidinilytica]|uniref:4-carboxymuconolactone decarboxylase n=1 Tax=Rhizorhabdus histidinilytica TaxID=439228 RepID=A0A1T5G1Q4_9SPHN|nr:carboxymuconolactone decarboxylase family protein [Rhizorhabdus histidinilytica]SKC02376.1 4-carboxymuconolactone decarboxylase [Rhizorhabdus histidinilytica]